MFAERGWRNWYTRTFEGRVAQAVRVQVPPRALIFNSLEEYDDKDSIDR